MMKRHKNVGLKPDLHSGMLVGRVLTRHPTAGQTTRTTAYHAKLDMILGVNWK